MEILTKVYMVKYILWSEKNVTKNLDSLMQAIDANENLIPYIINCIKNKCTLGEICDTIKNIYGEFK